MGDLTIEPNEYGSYALVTSSGDKYRINDRDGALEIRVDHGGVHIIPQASNALELRGRLQRGADW